MQKIFVSYRREDSRAMSGRIYDKLITAFGNERVFMDIDTIPIGVDFRDYIREEIEEIDVMLVVIGSNWLHTSRGGSRRIDEPADYVRLEIEAAIKKQIPIVPVLVGDLVMLTVTDLPPSLESLAFRNAVKVDEGLDFHHHMDRLIKGLQRLFDNPPQSTSLRDSSDVKSTSLIEVWITISPDKKYRVTEIYVEEGSVVQTGDEILEYEDEENAKWLDESGIDDTVEAPCSGIIRSLHVTEDEILSRPNTRLFSILTTQPSRPSGKPSE